MEYLLMKFDQKTLMGMYARAYIRLWFSGEFCEVAKVVINHMKIQQALAKNWQYKKYEIKKNPYIILAINLK